MHSLNEVKSGRYLVITASDSRYEIDLDLMTLRRVAAFDMAQDRSLRRDGQTEALLRVQDCTVGRNGLLIVDFHLPGTFFTTRATTTVVSIEKQR